MPRPANAFYRGENVVVTFTADGPRGMLSYRATDDRGLCLRQGRQSVGLGRPIQVSLGSTLPTGFYRLNWELAGQPGDDSLCVIPPPWEDRGDYRLFALHPDDWSPDSQAAAMQVGVRQVRYGIHWPTSEPQPGQWDDEYISRGYDLARRAGLQMLVILGYTPLHQAQRAENCHLWVNDAWFTWHPREPNRYMAYADRIAGFAAGKAIEWPPAGTGTEGVTERLPWVSGWEMWNEVDMVFYFGYWNRYVDLLRLTYAASRRLTPETPVLYGGSTGNWVTMGMLFSGSGRFCYDYNSFQPYNGLETDLSRWYSGAPQIPYCAGLPRETWHTEAYCVPRDPAVPMSEYRETPGDILRLYVTLKAWREPAYYRSGCTGGWIRDDFRPNQGIAMLERRDGHLSPTPLYPAFAATRQLLSDATLVGPVTMGAGATAYALLKHGKLMIAAW